MNIFSNYQTTNGNFEATGGYQVIPDNTVVEAYIEEAQVKNGTKADYLNFKWRFKIEGSDRNQYQSLFINGEGDYAKQQIMMFGAILENCGFTPEQLMSGAVPDPLTTSWLKSAVELKKMSIKFGVKTVKKGYDKATGQNYDLKPEDYYKENYIKAIGKAGASASQPQEKITIGRAAPVQHVDLEDNLPF